MWDEPYLETCCRSALHRVWLAGAAGRPGGLKDGPCLARLAGEGFVVARGDGRFEVTGAGLLRHGEEVGRPSFLKKRSKKLLSLWPRLLKQAGARW